MKTSKSPENAEVTPSKKKLTQARLPFKLLSDVSPKPDATQTRKRKLSAPEAESVTKVGKISKENDLIEETVLISDEDSKDSVQPKKKEKLPNPYVKLVDAARKKKLQKTKKKRKTSKVLNGSCEVQGDSDNKDQESELMDVDEPADTEVNVSKDTEDIQIDKSNTEKSETKELSNSSSVIANGNSEVVTLEDDIAEKSQNQPQKKDNIEKTVLDESHTETTTDDTSNQSPSKSEEEESKSMKEENQNTPKRSMRKRTKVEPNNNSKGSPSTKSNKQSPSTKPNNSSPSTKSNKTSPSTKSKKSSPSTKLNKSLPAQSSPSTKLNDSVCSAPSTPKNSRSSSVTNSAGDVSLNESTTSANLTPKQVRKKCRYISWHGISHCSFSPNYILTLYC